MSAARDECNLSQGLLAGDFGIEFFNAVVADAVAELGFGVLLDVCFNGRRLRRDLMSVSAV
jgi:hypothetical protein